MHADLFINAVNGSKILLAMLVSTKCWTALMIDLPMLFVLLLTVKVLDMNPLFLKEKLMYVFHCYYFVKVLK